MANATTEEGQSTPHAKREFASNYGTEEVVGKKPLNSYFVTIVHLVKGYVGTGIFAMGQAMANGGIILGPILLFIIAIINLNCQHVLIHVLEKLASEEEEEVRPSFSETVQYGFESSKKHWINRHAHRMGSATIIFLVCTELGFCCVYFVFIAEHIVDICVNNNLMEYEAPENNHIILAIILIPMWSTTFLGNLKLLLPLSIIANVLMWLGIVLIIYYSTYNGLPPIDTRQFIASYERYPFFFGTVLFSFEGITMVIPLRNEMENPKNYTNLYGVLNVGMVFVTILYFVIGFLGYWSFGEDVEGSIFLNLVPSPFYVADIMSGFIAIAVMFTFTLHMYIPFEITFPLFYKKYGPFKRKTLVIILYKTVPVLIMYTLANIIPFLELFITLVGAISGSMLALILPATLQLLALHEENTIFTIIKAWIYIFIGVVGMILGTVMTLIAIVHEFQKIYKSE